MNLLITIPELIINLPKYRKSMEYVTLAIRQNVQTEVYI